jgi:alpha-L-arabinofuranosidase
MLCAAAPTLTLLMTLPLFAAARPAPTATVAIDAAKPGPRINPRLYGIFLEEINHGVDGGLYAELVRNRGFEDAKPPEGFTLRDGRWLDADGYDAGYHYDTNGLPWWSLVAEGGGKGSMCLDLAQPLNPTNPRSLRLEIEGAGAGRVGIANEGFWGIAAKQGERYNLSFWARTAGGFTGPLAIALESAGGSACTDVATIAGLAPEWRQFKATLTAVKTDPAARLVVAATAPGIVWFDMVSLFPAATFKGRPNGLRADLAQLLADLKPGFVRFPGGCVVEGGTIETAYDWKETTGPIEGREEIWNAWNYRRTHGMGFFEYFQFCEDIGAEPLFVAFAGQSCAYRHWEHVPLDDMGWVIDRYLDAVEYANGPVDSTWGKLRAAAGHPAPFDLKWLEIGNENMGQGYEERYPLIYKPLKEKYPAIQTIACFNQRRAPTEMVDDHFYNAPLWFMSNVGLYDRRDRALPPVYVGEIAVTSGEGGEDKGNVISALAEGAFLMGIERNADVVKMVSYAPLLAHVRGRSGWHGMIYFDSATSYGTASYHLWKLFGLNVPDVTLSTTVDFTPSSVPAIAGAVGLGTWDTAAEFKDLRVEKDGAVLYAADFARGADAWRREGGAWNVVDGAWRQRDPVVGLSYAGDEAWTDYTLSVKARKLGGAEGFLIVFGRTGGSQYWWNLGGWGNREHGIEFNRGPVGPHVRGSIEQDRWYDIQVVLKGSRIRCYLDGALVHDETAPSTERFFALAGRDETRDELILKVINVAGEPVAGTFSVSGAGGLSPWPALTVLRGESLDDNNSLERPRKIVPVTSTLAIPGPEFRYEAPPYSCSIIRIGMRR